jgi:hypothetical protein
MFEDKDLMTTWRKLLTEELESNKESFEDIEYITECDLDEEFENDYGAEVDSYFTAWTKEFIYYCGSYDGKEYVSSIRRNPPKDE